MKKSTWFAELDASLYVVADSRDRWRDIHTHHMEIVYPDVEPGNKIELVLATWLINPLPYNLSL